MWSDVANTGNNLEDGLNVHDLHGGQTCLMTLIHHRFPYLFQIPSTSPTYLLPPLRPSLASVSIIRAKLPLNIQIEYSIMPGEVISEPNPQPLPSHLPDFLEKLCVELDHKPLDQKAYDALSKFRRAACYIAAGKSYRYMTGCLPG